MKTRIISALFLLPLLGFVVIGGRPLYFLVMLFGLLAMYEFYKGFENMGIHPFKIAGYICATILYIILYVYMFTGADHAKLSEGLLLWLFITVSSGLVLCLFTTDENNISDGLATIVSVIYLPFFFSHISLIDGLKENSRMIWLVFITAFGTDTFAYFSGMFFGKHKLIPNISPKKTVEGAIGGVIGSTILSLIFCAIMFPQHLAAGLFIGILGSIFAQFGDLIASAFKRKMGIKDYGRLIPGHGGILDRFDSVILTAPFVYYYIVLIVNR